MRTKELESLKPSASKTIHICFSTDEADLVPLGIAVSSAIRHSSSAEQLVFHVITTETLASTIRQRLQSIFVGSRFEIHVESALQERVSALLQGSGLRLSPFSLAGFYLEHYLGLEDTNGDGTGVRVLYLDTDVIVQGDVADLYSIDLFGHALAFGKDCSQSFRHLDQDIAELDDFASIHKDFCGFDKGVLVADLKKWKEQRLTNHFESWMRRVANIPDLYTRGKSLPPWSLAFSRKSQVLGANWHCSGGGRSHFTRFEWRLFRSKKLKEGLGVSVRKTEVLPFVAPCSDAAKIIHFDGPLKPWHQETWEGSEHQRAPMCSAARTEARAWDAVGAVEIGEARFVKCAWLWHLQVATDLLSVEGNSK